MNIIELAFVVRDNIMKIGSNKLKGKPLNSFDKGLLIFDEDELIEHESIQAGGLAYYNVLLGKVRATLSARKSALELWWGKKYLVVGEELQDSSNYKPTAAQIENSVRMKYGKKYRFYVRKIREAEEALNAMESWCNAWKQKSFSMQNIGEFKIEKLGDKEVVKRKVKRVLLEDK